jgi:hypothetical protein
MDDIGRRYRVLVEPPLRCKNKKRPKREHSTGILFYDTARFDTELRNAARIAQLDPDRKFSYRALYNCDRVVAPDQTVVSQIAYDGVWTSLKRAELSNYSLLSKSIELFRGIAVMAEAGTVHSNVHRGTVVYDGATGTLRLVGYDRLNAANTTNASNAVVPTTKNFYRPRYPPEVYSAEQRRALNPATFFSGAVAKDIPGLKEDMARIEGTVTKGTGPIPDIDTYSLAVCLLHQLSRKTDTVRAKFQRGFRDVLLRMARIDPAKRLTVEEGLQEMVSLRKRVGWNTAANVSY